MTLLIEVEPELQHTMHIASKWSANVESHQSSQPYAYRASDSEPGFNHDGSDTTGRNTPFMTDAYDTHTHTVRKSEPSSDNDDMLTPSAIRRRHCSVQKR